MEIIAVCSQIHTKHINTLYGQNVELLNVNLVVQIVTNGGFKRLNRTHRPICSSLRHILQRRALKFRYLFLFVASRFYCLLTFSSQALNCRTSHLPAVDSAVLANKIRCHTNMRLLTVNGSKLFHLTVRTDMSDYTDRRAGVSCDVLQVALYCAGGDAA
jgi:hypothetical protein